MQLANPADAAPAASETLGTLVVREMRRMYGDKFTKQWQGLTPRELRDSWDRYMGGMTEHEVREGLLACLTRDWPPTVPEFVRLCRPWLDPDVAFYIAVRGMAARRAGSIGEWPHPAVYWAAATIGAHDLASNGYAALRSRWETALTAQLARQDWKAIPEPSQALPAPGQTVTTREEAEAALQRMGAGQIINNRSRDTKAWARRIVENPRRHSPTAIKMAKQALGVTEGAEAC